MASKTLLQELKEIIAHQVGIHTSTDSNIDFDLCEWLQNGWIGEERIQRALQTLSARIKKRRR